MKAYVHFWSYEAKLLFEWENLFQTKAVETIKTHISFLLLLYFRVPQLMPPKVPQPYGLLYYPRIGPSNFLHHFRATTPPKQRKRELEAYNL
jgi:hypothetical protein